MRPRGRRPEAPRPRYTLGDGATRVMLAVDAGARTYADLIEATGFARVTVHHHLVRLRDVGLVTWETNRKGTLRPLFYRSHEPTFAPTNLSGNRSGPGDCANSPRSVARPTEEV